jgi:hypothetical protein
LEDSKIEKEKKMTKTREGQTEEQKIETQKKSKSKKITLNDCSESMVTSFSEISETVPEPNP